ncbi:uncharacterized protein LOC119684009 isoform X2 [Teleopsis dalmanni]|nr:uncharacterized protein LOC119684009 isoform X2 [Teleopsis dalmanni]
MIRHNTADALSHGYNNITTLSATLNNNASLPVSNICATNPINNSNPLDALPKQFVLSMKTLFDILDDQHTGFVKLTDIEKGWQDDGCKGLPRGVLNSLRKVTPVNGLLSFERFCAGLKLCLLRNQTEFSGNSNGLISSSINNTFAANKSKSPIKLSRPPSAPVLEIENPQPATLWCANPTATVRPHISNKQRAYSMPQLSPDSELDADVANAVNSVYNSPPPPPKPPRASVAAAAAAANSGILTTVNTTPTTSINKTEIRHALQNWQMGVLLNEMDAKDDKRKSTYLGSNQFQYRGAADGGSSSTTDSINSTTAQHLKKNSNKRREPRRHTLQNGIDYNMLKRLKQYEEEREVLLLGLDAVEKAKDWYLQQLAHIQEKMKYLGRMGTHVEQWSEERLNFQRTRVLEVNRNLSALADTWERSSFPIHFNLAIRKPPKNTAQHINNAGTVGLLQPVDRLRQQNRHLTNEVSIKTDRITLLEREKQGLLRELFELQQRTGSVARNNGFISALSQSSPVCSSSSGGLGDADVVY